MTTLEIQIKNHNFILHPSGAVFWKAYGLLLISDVHFGKISHFRKHGFAVPEEAIGKNFEQLTAVVAYFNPGTILFLGDLFHSSLNREWNLFRNWTANCPADCVLIAGNHDIIDRIHYEAIHIRVCQEMVIDGFLLTHHPEERQGYYNFSGHVHPGVQLKGIGRQFLNLPCFFRKEHQIILPAFGAFTGKYILTPSEKDVVYAVTKDAVILVV